MHRQTATTPLHLSRIAALAAASLALTGVMAAPSHAVSTEGSTAASPTVTSPVGTITWLEDCEAWITRNGMECGTLTAPMDYTNPSKGDVHLFMTRVPAKDQANKKGTIFINPGGPGEGGAQYTSFFAQILGDNTATHFDIIGIDPRGLGDSRPAFRCGNPQGPNVPAFPLKDSDIAPTNQANAAFREACLKHSGEIGKYMSTADLARDINLASELLGEDKINFAGISYGTHVAATLSNMFSHKVGAVAAISALDPQQWSTGYGNDSAKTPAFQRIGSTEGAREAWTAAMDQCVAVGPDKCDAAPTIKEDWDLLHRAGRLAVMNVDGTNMTYDEAARALTGKGYTPRGFVEGLDLVTLLAKSLRDQPIAPEERERLTEQLAKTARDAAVPQLGVPDDVLRDYVKDLPARDARSETPSSSIYNALAWQMTSLVGVLCGDTDNPTSDAALVDAQRRNRNILPGVGEVRTWQSGACVNWPLKAQNPYKGPFTASTQIPMLILQNEFDTATPYKLGALALQRQAPGSRIVLSKGGFGHAPYLDETCTKPYLDNYFMTGQVPDRDVACTPAKGLFD